MRSIADDLLAECNGRGRMLRAAVLGFMPTNRFA
jgi:hypothetical protein